MASATPRRSPFFFLNGVFFCGLLFCTTNGPSDVRAEDPKQPLYGIGLWALPPQTPHRVIRSPQLLTPDQQRSKDDRGLYHGHPATIDAALVEPVWKQPYAYGYFGATPTGHWQRHFGYHRAYTQWTLK